MAEEPVQVGRIEVTRLITSDTGDDGDTIGVTWSEGLSLLDALGMLRMAEDTIIRDMGGS